jgi:gamma-glutamyl-gamma-aminobutyrate hydrolase PuuD
VSVPEIVVPHWRAPTFERTRHFHDSLRQAGAEPLVLDGAELPSRAAGLLLTGGVDVDPHHYGERRGGQTDRPNKPRDEQELALVRQALERDIPLLAVCRGHQVLNVAVGGSLLQHIEGDSHKADDAGHSRWHEVSLTGNGRLAAVYEEGAVLRVNSRHHQAVTPERLAEPLRELARSPDGFIEAMESRAHRWVVGVQWHPERPEMHPAAYPLFAAFVAACRV